MSTAVFRIVKFGFVLLLALFGELNSKVVTTDPASCGLKFRSTSNQSIIRNNQEANQTRNSHAVLFGHTQATCFRFAFDYLTFPLECAKFSPQLNIVIEVPERPDAQAQTAKSVKSDAVPQL